ncbi:MAG TPA: sugar phosphate isomerase/epimerase family protein [Verrucomicrobiae bacterium]
MISSGVTRREFLVSAGLFAVAGLVGAAEDSTEPRFPLLGFVKPIQKHSYGEIADISAAVGWDGVELPVRKGGTVEPARVEEELPKVIEALKKNKIAVPVIATDVDDASDPLAQRVLRTASQLGIPQYRMKHLYYDLNKPIAPQLAEFRGRMRDIAQLDSELKIQGTFQNHSGKNYVGAPVWDMWELMRELDPKSLAAYFDIGHATLEGGLSWPLQARLLEPHLAVVSVKDFKWTQIEAGPSSKSGKPRWKDQWCPLGDGMVQAEFFSYLKKTKFRGPICTHYEYPLGDGREMIAAMKRDLAVLREWLA